MNKVLFAIGLSTLLVGMNSHAGSPHVHGNAAMQVVVEGTHIDIDLQSPMDSLVGFEHAPRNEQQRQAIKAVADRFRDPATFFAPAAEAKCVAGPASLRLPFASDSAELKGSASKDKHSELEATIRFHCTHPSALKGMKVMLFDAFPRLHRLDVQMITARGQSAARLTPKQRHLQW